MNRAKFAVPNGSVRSIPRLFMEHPIHPTLSDLESLVRQAGEIVLAGVGQEHEIGYKGPLDLVTEIDHRSEDYLVGAIRERFPADKIITEESGSLDGDSANRWFIDPLDGTINYAHGIPLYCVSIAYADLEGLRLGAIYDPRHAECFSAERGRGAWLNGRPIHISPIDELAHSLMVTGFVPSVWEEVEKNLVYFARLTRRTQGVRRLGTAALDLCYLAAGRVEGFWELRLSPWDVAAGGLIAREAGAIVTDLEGHPDFLVPPYAILAANPGLHAEILALFHGPDAQADEPPIPTGAE